jgi:hypothetical protein
MFSELNLCFGRPTSPLSAHLWDTKRDLPRSHSIVVLRIWPESQLIDLPVAVAPPPTRPTPAPPRSSSAAAAAVPPFLLPSRECPPQGISRRRATGGRRFLASPATDDEDGEGDGGSAARRRRRGANLQWRAGRRAPAGGAGLRVSWQPCCRCNSFSPTSPV